MAKKRQGARTLRFPHRPRIAGRAAIGGVKEGEGPLGAAFDIIAQEDHFGQDSWEKAESELQREALTLAARRAGGGIAALDVILAGDLLNQCIASSFASVASGVPYLGQYGACSTMAQTMLLGAVLVDGGYADLAAAAASSHFCTAERQYRFPLAYGGQRTPSAQWTATAAGALVLSAAASAGHIAVTAGMAGQMVDLGVADVNNMGAAMAPAACRTIIDFLHDTETVPTDYDGIFTGDLSRVGASLLCELARREGVDLTPVYSDCGSLLYDDTQDTHAGGSGCGCSAAVLCGHILRQMEAGRLHRVLFCGTGAMMSPTSVQQGQNIAGICHAVLLERQEGD